MIDVHHNTSIMKYGDTRRTHYPNELRDRRLITKLVEISTKLVDISRY